MFTRCSVCEYLKLLIEQTPRDQCALPERFDIPLGSAFRLSSNSAIGTRQGGGASCPKRWCAVVRAHRQYGSAQDSGAMRLEPVGDTLVQGGGQALSERAQWIHVVWHHSDHTPPPRSVRRLPAWGGDAKQHFLVELAPGLQGRGVVDNAWVHLRRQYTQGDNKSVHYVVSCAVAVRIGQHATLEDRCIVLTRGAHTQEVG